MPRRGCQTLFPKYFSRNPGFVPSQIFEFDMVRSCFAPRLDKSLGEKGELLFFFFFLFSESVAWFREGCFTLASLNIQPRCDNVHLPG